ncbi:MAG: hypothetical protein JSW61_05465 [Candidatus Thorarchaeota archaeon]|nr:MAG: hypothetical protein JSW61_05465 [Candidatus Thorarchaeota archaeon]
MTLREGLLMPSLLITSSRKTSNRVRSFIRDLSQVIPDSERFNRGGMSLKELISRINASGARAACIVSMEKGNPRIIQLIDANGSNLVTVLVESAMLRRETSGKKSPRIFKANSVAVRTGSSEQTLSLAQVIAEILGLSLDVVEKPALSHEPGLREGIMWFEDLPAGKILWTFYNSHEKSEVGPRIRIATLNNE